MNDDSSLISGQKTTDDWRTFRKELAASQDASTWRRAFDEYFRSRLDLRYFNPIKLLQQHGTSRGEGFSILAIQCSVIEFLESTVQGLKYRFVRRQEVLGPHEYSSSRSIYVAFLTSRAPFSAEFNAALATQFYEDIRCGLLHEARTKNGWRVWAKSPDGRILEPKRHVIYRDDLQLALDSFVAAYGAQLCSDNELQKAFIRKFDDLCE